jgi:pimeloyl-ACP methyl ester carboxylesterase
MSTQLTRDHLVVAEVPERGPGGMYVHESGTPGSPAIVFIHGLGQSGHEWRRHMAELAGFHCLAPDLPGHGRSNHLPLPSNERIADLLAELIATRVPAGRAHIVGISWAALLTQVLMQRHPGRVDRAVADGLPLVWPRGARLLMLWFVTLVVPFLHTRPVMALYKDIADAADLRVASRLAFWNVWAVNLAHLSAATEAPCPILLVAGEKEGFMRPGDAALARLMPHAEAWYAPGLDHCWQRKAPDLHIRMLEAWFTGQELPSELRREPEAPPAAAERLRREITANRRSEMYVHESGTPGSPAIIFIHGAGQSGREWRGHMERLAGFHCLAPDLPGYGRSNRLEPSSKERIADLVAELIETRVPAGRASVVGISSAGTVIHALLERHPDRVERAVIDGSPPYDAPRAGRALMGLFMTALSPFIHTRPVLALFRDTHDPVDLRVASRRAFRLALAECFTTFAATDAQCPTLLVAGEKESRVRPTDAALAAIMPRAEAWYAPGRDHCWQRVAPDLHIRMVEAWVSGQSLPFELRREPSPSPKTVEHLRRTVTATA